MNKLRSIVIKGNYVLEKWYEKAIYLLGWFSLVLICITIFLAFIVEVFI